MNDLIKEKYYSKEDQLFHIIKIDQLTYMSFDKTYDTLEKFYEALGNQLNNANLIDYDFSDDELKKYDLSKAKISSTTMKRLGKYNSRLYKKISKDEQALSLIPSASLDLVPSRKLNNIFWDKSEFLLCYISDLHLNHKIVSDYKESINKYELHN